MSRLRWWVGVVLALVLTGFAPPSQTPLITMAVRAGFDGRFRDLQWFTVWVDVQNDGDPVTGTLVVRPDTSGSALLNSFSAPVTLANGARQSVPLYVNMRAFGAQLRVELIDTDGVVVAAETAPLAVMQTSDMLTMVFSQSASGVIDLSGIRFSDDLHVQVNGRLRDLPERGNMLEAVNTIVFTDLDSGAMTPAQQQAVIDWTAAGGHLIVTGGAVWQTTAAAFPDVLPLQPADSADVDDLAGLADWLRIRDRLATPSVISTGTLSADAKVLATQGDQPLVVRRAFGDGTIDYLAVDPNTAPLRGWNGMNDLWRALISSVPTAPSWGSGVQSWDASASAVEVLPNFNLLPDSMLLAGFLGLYILLIGPVNYFLLARINRRELAWVTIPILIVVFSGLAYAVGGSLRGREATLNRLSLVRSWPDVARARVDGLIGLLSPTRTGYELALADGASLRPVPRSEVNQVLSSAQTTMDIVQSDQFTAHDFIVDASFVAGFNSTSTVEKPAIGGTIALGYNDEGSRLTARGSVRNDTELPLEYPVLLLRNQVVRLGDTIAPGDFTAFNERLDMGDLAAPVLYVNSSNPYSFYPGYAFNAFNMSSTLSTLSQIVEPPEENSGDAALYRRQLLVGSFANDFSAYVNNLGVVANMMHGDRVYVAGWQANTSLDVELEGAGWSSDDLTLVITELEVEPSVPTQTVTIGGGRFTWLLEEKQGYSDMLPLGISMGQGERYSFRFTPLPDAVLSEVDEMIIHLDRVNLGNANLPIGLYNWQTDEWDDFNLIRGVVTLETPADYLGPLNAVLVELDASELGDYFRADRLYVEQRGRF